MKRALIISVGTGSGADVNIVKPLVKTIRTSNPDYTIFITSQESKENAEKIIDELELSDKSFDIEELTDSENLEKIFRELNATFRAMYKKGYKPSEITVDYTSGTKAMTAGLVLAGVFNSCGLLEYITGERKDGIVQDGTECFLTIQPSGIFARREIQWGIRLIEEMRFDSALVVFKAVNTSLLDDYEKEMLEQAKLLANAYNYWDKFEHFKFCGEYKKVKFKYQEIDDFKLRNNNTCGLLNNIGKSIKHSKINHNILIDLYNNAKRRFDEGKYDDALARLYRLSEMFAQFILDEKYQIKTGDIDIEKIPPDKRGDIETYRDERDNKIKIGLKRAYVLLKDLNSTAGKKFFENKHLQNILNDRNDSILAHGTKPINRDASERLFKEVEKLLLCEIPDFQQKREELDFPWRRKTQE